MIGGRETVGLRKEAWGVVSQMDTKERGHAWAGWDGGSHFPSREKTFFCTNFVCMLNENIDLGDTGRTTSMKRRAKTKKNKKNFHL